MTLLFQSSVLFGGLTRLAKVGGCSYYSHMSVQELETAVSSLSREELSVFHRWFEEFIAEDWDRQIEADVKAGRLDHLAAKADRDFEAGRCTPL